MFVHSLWARDGRFKTNKNKHEILIILDEASIDSESAWRNNGVFISYAAVGNYHWLTEAHIYYRTVLDKSVSPGQHRHVGKAPFLPEAPGEKPFPGLLLWLEAAHSPWLVAASSICKARHAASSLFPSLCFCPHISLRLRSPFSSLGEHRDGIYQIISPRQDP